jgi:uncharacterized protein YceH (UPF0502 family)
MTLPALSLLETRVLGVLIEKQHTVPDTYPMSIHALTAGCNQKSSRDPVMDVTDAEVQAAVDNLKRLSLVLETSGGRVMRYAHNFGRVLGIPAQATALLAVLMLRGPQTVGELRINTERLHRFGDTSAVEAFLRELAERAAGALVVELARQPGAREPRWAHLLSGAPPAARPAAQPAVARPADVAAAAPTDARSAVNASSRDDIVSLRAEVNSLAAEVQELRALVARLCNQLRIDPD